MAADSVTLPWLGPPDRSSSFPRPSRNNLFPVAMRSARASDGVPSRSTPQPRTRIAGATSEGIGSLIEPDCSVTITNPMTARLLLPAIIKNDDFPETDGESPTRMPIPATANNMSTPSGRLIAVCRRFSGTRCVMSHNSQLENTATIVTSTSVAIQTVTGSAGFTEYISVAVASIVRRAMESGCVIMRKLHSQLFTALVLKAKTSSRFSVVMKVMPSAAPRETAIQPGAFCAP